MPAPGLFYYIVSYLSDAFKDLYVYVLYFCFKLANAFISQLTTQQCIYGQLFTAALLWFPKNIHSCRIRTRVVSYWGGYDVYCATLPGLYIYIILYFHKFISSTATARGLTRPPTRAGWRARPSCSSPAPSATTGAPSETASDTRSQSESGRTDSECSF